MIPTQGQRHNDTDTRTTSQGQRHKYNWQRLTFQRSQRFFSGCSFLGQIGHKSVDDFGRRVDEGVGRRRSRRWSGSAGSFTTQFARRHGQVIASTAAVELLLRRWRFRSGNRWHAAVRWWINNVAAVVSATTAAAATAATTAASIIVVVIIVVAVVAEDVAKEDVLLLIVGDGLDQKSSHVALNFFGE